LELKGEGATFACGWGGGGSQFGQRDRHSGTLKAKKIFRRDIVR
jgi:hypothetical protein